MRETRLCRFGTTISWNGKSGGKYGIPVEEGVGVFNGDTGILKEINEFAETATVEFEDGRFADYSFKQLENWNLPML